MGGQRSSVRLKLDGWDRTRSNSGRRSGKERPRDMGGVQLFFFILKCTNVGVTFALDTPSLARSALRRVRGNCKSNRGSLMQSALGPKCEPQPRIN